MKLNQYERAVLINQLSIRQAVVKGEDFKQQIEVLENGYETEYARVFSAIGVYPDENSVTKDDSKFVLDALSVHEAISRYIEAHPEDTQAAKEKWARFAGFSGNEETELMGYTQFVVNRQGMFQEQRKYWTKEANFDSHSPSADIYRRMVKKWHELPTERRYSMTREEVLAVREARKYPG